MKKIVSLILMLIALACIFPSMVMKVKANEECEVHDYVGGICSNCGYSILGNEWLAPNFAEGDYTMIAIPDPQNLVNYHPDAYMQMMQWIVDNRDDLNIQAVMNMGDMVNNNTSAEWTASKAGMDLLKDSGIPFMPMRGNHDDSAWFNQYYDYSTYGSSQSWFGGSYHSDKLDHTYWFVTVGQREYMILSLGWAPSWDVLTWAQGVVEKHADKNVIINCHAYMNSDGTFLSTGDAHCVSSYLSGYPNGDDVWAAFKGYKNVVLAMGGHIHSADVVKYTDKNGDGRDVASLLFDRQNDDTRSKLGMLAVLTFHADDNTVDINWYSTNYDALYKAKNQFSINVPNVCEHSYTSEATKATCTQGGGTTFTCTKCGYSYLNTTTSPLNHKYEILDVAPSCTTAGYQESICSVCGHTDRKLHQNDITNQFKWNEGHVISAIYGNMMADPNWVASDYVDISMFDSIEIVTGDTVNAKTTLGIAFYDASQKYISGAVHTDKMGNEYGIMVHNLTVPENAVYVRTTWYSMNHEKYDGAKLHTFYCKGYSTEIPPLGHNFVETVTPPTCTEQGYTTYTCTCGYSYVDDYVDADGEHDFTEWSTIREATYNADGEESRKCNKCSHVEFRSVSVSIVTSGNLGKGATPTDKVIYTLYSDGTMVLEGTGALFGTDWRGDNQPFIDYRKQIKHLIIGEGITSTTSGSLVKLSNLETIQFPSTFTHLPQNALMSCFRSDITKLTIPATVVHLGAYSIGHYTGDASAEFTDIIIENPNIQITNHVAVFNGGTKLDQLTLYSYGSNNKVSAYAEKYGIRYVDLNNFLEGEYGDIHYELSDGVLILEPIVNNACIPADNQPWASYSESITKIIIGEGIVSIPQNAFADYPALTEVALPSDLDSIGDGAFSVTQSNATPLTMTLPRRLSTLGKDVFKGRNNVELTVYSGSLGADLSEPGVEVITKKVFKLLLIGNSYSEDASNGTHTTGSQLLDILQAMLGEDAEITVALLSSGGKGMHWHATQAEQGNTAYSFKIITSNNPVWKSQGSYTSADALAWTDWDVVSLQPYNINVSTGKESVPYPDSTDPKFYHIEDSSAYMLDHVSRYAPYADIYFYMHWAQTSSTVLNAALSSYNKAAAFIPQVLDFVGTESGVQFKDIIPVGLSIQNARTTYLALLRYNTTAYADGNLNLITDAQIGLQRDGGHVSFNIGRYIAALTFAEMIIPENMRADGYVLPDIRITESVGKLPKEYSEIAQKSVFAAVNGWKNGSLVVTNIEGYLQDPTVEAKEVLLNMPLNLIEGDLKIQIRAAILSALSNDFTVDSVEIDADNNVASVTIRFGYTSVTVEMAYVVHRLDIISQPENVQQEIGENFSVTVKVEGEGLTYQWYYKDSYMQDFAISSNQTSSYAYTMENYRHNRQVYCVITDAYGNTVTTDVATITRPPIELKLIAQPQDVCIEIGEEFSIYPIVEGEGLTYLWYYKDSYMQDFAVSSNKTSAYTYTMESYRHNRQVYCVITDQYGNAVTTDVATMSHPPRKLEIMSQPTDITANLGEVFSVKVVAQGEELSYQWYYKDSYMKDFAISCNTSSNYSYDMTDYRDGRQVYCVITDKYGNQVTTNIATIKLDTLN